MRIDMRRELERGRLRKFAQFRGLSPLGLVPQGTGQRTGQPGPIPRNLGPFAGEPGPALDPLHGKLNASPLGPPMGLREVAQLIGCSPWTVRQTLIPGGLPHLRFTANGRLIFYRDQVIRWIENQQRGGK